MPGKIRLLAERVAAMEKRLKRKLADGVLPFRHGVKQACRTPNIVMIGGVPLDQGPQTELMRLGARYPTVGNDVDRRLRAGRADIERMRTIPVPGCPMRGR